MTTQTPIPETPLQRSQSSPPDARPRRLRLGGREYHFWAFALLIALLLLFLIARQAVGW